MLRSHTVCRTFPPPTAKPFTAATTGLGTESISFVHVDDRHDVAVVVGLEGVVLAADAEELVAGAGEDRDAQRHASAEGAERVGEFESGLHPELVARVGPVDREPHRRRRPRRGCPRSSRSCRSLLAPGSPGRSCSRAGPPRPARAAAAVPTKRCSRVAPYMLSVACRWTSRPIAVGQLQRPHGVSETEFQSHVECRRRKQDRRRSPGSPG